MKIQYFYAALALCFFASPGTFRAAETPPATRPALRPLADPSNKKFTRPSTFQIAPNCPVPPDEVDLKLDQDYVVQTFRFATYWPIALNTTQTPIQGMKIKQNSNYQGIVDMWTPNHKNFPSRSHVAKWKKKDQIKDVKYPFTTGRQVIEKYAPVMPVIMLIERGWKPVWHDNTSGSTQKNGKSTTTSYVHSYTNEVSTTIGITGSLGGTFEGISAGLSAAYTRENKFTDSVEYGESTTTTDDISVTVNFTEKYKDKGYTGVVWQPFERITITPLPGPLLDRHLAEQGYGIVLDLGLDKSGLSKLGVDAFEAEMGIEDCELVVCLRDFDPLLDLQPKTYTFPKKGMHTSYIKTTDIGTGKGLDTLPKRQIPIH